VGTGADSAADMGMGYCPTSGNACGCPNALRN
jgi:hypothetical protein